MEHTMNETDNFLKYLEKRKIRFDYKIDDFLYGHEGPCPQAALDHPFGQAPEIMNIPQQEWDDWQQYVSDYYYSRNIPFAKDVAQFSLMHAFLSFFGKGLIGYKDITDKEFTELLSEGLYSKFLCQVPFGEDGANIPAQYQKLFGDWKFDSKREYFVSDYSCMRVIKNPHPEEYVAPTVVLLSRPKKTYKTVTDYDDAYEVEAIALWYWDKDKSDWLQLPGLLVRGENAWTAAQYFVLQGAIHRINLIDHTKVHFPSDTINALTKTILPKRNLVFQLLIPHFWLQLPVNNTVLESDRSLISRKSWYPWSPFVAQGAEVRKLLPFGWYGSQYYSADDPEFAEPNPSYPNYDFSMAWSPGKIPSRYGLFFDDYYEVVRKFVAAIVSTIPPDDDKHSDWVEIQNWAHHIAAWIPGFPDWDNFVRDSKGNSNAEDNLVDVLTYIIMNAAVIHSADHGVLHKMMNDEPVPFVLRVAPPKTKDESLPTEKLDDLIADLENKLELTDQQKKELGKYVKGLEALLGLAGGPAKLTVLCWPSDLLYARMCDMLFYRPHNASLLIDCKYPFTKEAQQALSEEIARGTKATTELEEHKDWQYWLTQRQQQALQAEVDEGEEAKRQLLDPKTVEALGKAIKEFQAGLRAVNAKYSKEQEKYGFPIVEPRAGLSEPERIKAKFERCIATGIQY
jgi:hypothetical protein